MPDKHPDHVHQIDLLAAADPGGSQYRSIAGQLRELARRCRYRTGRRELIALAVTFEYRADRFDYGWHE